MIIYLAELGYYAYQNAYHTDYGTNIAVWMAEFAMCSTLLNQMSRAILRTEVWNTVTSNIQMYLNT